MWIFLGRNIRNQKPQSIVDIECLSFKFFFYNFAFFFSLAEEQVQICLWLTFSLIHSTGTSFKFLFFFSVQNNSSRKLKEVSPSPFQVIYKVRTARAGSTLQLKWPGCHFRSSPSTYQVDTQHHGSWTCAPKFGKCITLKGKPCNTVQCEDLSMRTGVSANFFRWMGLWKASLQSKSVMSCAIFRHVHLGPTQRELLGIEVGIQLEEVDKGVRSDALGEGLIVRRRHAQSRGERESNRSLNEKNILVFSLA